MARGFRRTGVAVLRRWQRARRPSIPALVGALAVAGALGLPGCTKPAAPPPQAVEVRVAEVAQQDVPVHTEWVGTTDGYINAQIRAKVQGYLLTKGYREGSTVKAGQLLYQLDPRQYQADLDKALGDLAQAKANLARSQLNEAKYRPLVAVGAVSRREYDDTVQEVRANQAAVEAAKGERGRREAERRVDQGHLADRRRRRDHSGPDRRSDLAGDRHDHRVAGQPDQGLLPDQRAGVPEVRRRHRALPPDRRRQHTRPPSS